MILITGSTGLFGGAAIDFLLKRGVAPGSIAAFARDKAKAEKPASKGVNVRLGDYDDIDTLLEAMKGVEKLLFVSGNDIVKRLKQHENVINAAKQSGVKHIVYTSTMRKNETETSPLAIVTASHFATEKMIKASGIPYTIMMNGLYADALPMFFGANVLETGIFLPAGDGKAAYATENDMAEGAAAILTGEGHYNKAYTIAGSENLSMHDIASMLSEVSGKSVPYISPTAEAFRETLTGAGVPMELIGLTAAFCEAIRQGELETSSRDLENILGRKPSGLTEFFKTIYGK